jgi:beta-glucosidase-like glycosyl hydrolase/CubicO group peptidase (beta-lactamase class C family)
MLKKWIMAIAPTIALLTLSLQEVNLQQAERVVSYPYSYLLQEKWVDSVYQAMSLEARIAQTMMVAAYSNRNESHYQEIEKLIKTYKIGGLIFFQGNPAQQARLSNRYQAAADLPLWIGMDAEWGLGMRLDSTVSYPRQMLLAAQAEDSLIYQMGAQIAEQCKMLGVHINFAPVTDVNSDPKNPVIGSRAFSDRHAEVSRRALLYMKGMQDNGILANAKHFPGHGDTDVDSHNDLPIIAKSKKKIEAEDLPPFKVLFGGGVASVMVGHIQVKAYEKKKNTPATISKAIVTDLLQKEMGYQGLIFTDALNMKGISNFYPSGEIELRALQAGNDVLLFPTDVPQAIESIKEALAKGTFSEETLAKSVKKILRAKYQLGLQKKPVINLAKLTERLNHGKYWALSERLFKNAITLLENKDQLLPFKDVEAPYTCLQIGEENIDVFKESLGLYAEVAHHSLLPKDYKNKALYAQLLKDLENKTVLVALTGLSPKQKNFGLDKETFKFIEKLQKESSVIVLVFASPYTLKDLKKVRNLLCTYHFNEHTQRILPQLLFGAVGFQGKLPVEIDKKLWPRGHGLSTVPLQRFQYSSPEAAQLDSEKMKTIDALMQEAIAKKMTPGGQILIARKGHVVWHKAYGHHSYDNKEPVTLESLYDIASVSKVAATLQAIMYLYEQGKLDLGKKASEYLPDMEKSNKKDATVQDILLHQAGFTAFIPYWQKTMNKGKHDPKYYQSSPSAEFPHQVGKDLYARADIEAWMWQESLQSPLIKAVKGKYPYTYSDLSFYTLKRMADALLPKNFEEFLHETFYKPLGIKTLTYNPLRQFPLSRIAPTEEDKSFRKSLVHGTVHDQGAAMQGGVAGHAGLFGNAHDLAKLMQMNLQGGQYGGKRYLQEATLQRFTAQADANNYRGLGWDKAPQGKVYGYIPSYASESSFGHSGFTGTLVWLDPQYELLIVILANRVHPDASNEKWIKEHMRRKIGDVVYEAMSDQSLRKPK